NFLWRTSSERHTHQWARRAGFSPLWIFDVKNLTAIRAQAGLYQRMSAAHHLIRDCLVDCLFVDVQLAASVRGKDDFLAVRRPVIRHVFSVIEGEPLRLANNTPAIELRHINIWLQNALQIHDSLAVGGDVDAEDFAAIAGE